MLTFYPIISVRLGYYLRISIHVQRLYGKEEVLISLDAAAATAYS